MLNAAGKIIYVGKAKNLQKRVSSYFHRSLDNKTLQMVKSIHSIEVTITRNEREALLLESNIIRASRPKYNIIFKDDKSYPYLYLSTQEQFPALSFYRGEKNPQGKYYGPYPSAGIAREALTILQTIFKLRQCDNTFFKNRTRPCLQYQIKRCTAPCVGYINEVHYKEQVNNAKKFLEGKSQNVLEQLMQAMEKASLTLDYERAANYRDQIAQLRRIQDQQIIMGENKNIDVLGLAELHQTACVHLLIIRNGRMLGSRQFFPQIEAIVDTSLPSAEKILESFILQHYLGVSGGVDLPDEILIGCTLDNAKTLSELLHKEANHKVSILKPRQGKARQWLDMASTSANEALKTETRQSQAYTQRIAALQEALNLAAPPERIECFDVSHSLGEATVASCVVFDAKGPLKSAYRRFNIRKPAKGDDYAALKEALQRHYTRLKSEEGILPDVLLIDGGKGQVKQAEMVLRELQVVAVMVLGVAKGPNRKAGLETLYLSSKGDRLILDSASPALHLIQQVRDEAHRFAITAHRTQRSKRRLHSRLEDIEGIGKGRRLALLRQFGGLQEVLQASVEELAKVKGISKALAVRLYEALHGS